jgi:hypothetical protein
MAQKTAVTTKPTKNKWIKKMKPVAIIGAAVLAGLGIYGAGLSGGGKNLTSNIKLGTSTLFGNLFKGSTPATTIQKVAGPIVGASTDYSMGGSVTTKATSGGGIGGFFSNLFGGMFGGGGGAGISLGNIISGIGGYFGSKANYELSERALDLQEKFGDAEVALQQELLALETMKAKAAIAAEKRQTAIGSTFMGHTSPIAAAAGVPGVEQGLQVADTWPPSGASITRPGPDPTVVRKRAGGAIGGSQPGLITQSEQRQVS